MGVGNPSRGDDGSGVAVAEILREKGFKLSFPCGENPENYLGKIASFKPGLVLIIDAVDFGGRPGAVRVFESQKVFQGLSTHTAGLDLSAEFLRLEAGSKVMVVGIQPQTLSGSISRSVRESVERLAEELEKKLCMNQ